MDQKDGSTKTARELCESFLLEQIEHSKQRYERLLACTCDCLGSKECHCEKSASNGQVKETENADQTIAENGQERSIGSDKPRSFYDVKDEATPLALLDPAIGDAEDSARMRISQIVTTTRNKALNAVTPLHKKYKHLTKQPSTMEQVYDGLKDPYVIMINIVNFSRSPAPRCGAEADTNNLKRFFQEANFNSVNCFYDVKKEEIMKVFKDTQKNLDLVRHDGFLCFIMSHGSKNGILTSDNHCIKVDEITSLFRGDLCPHFATKPKLFFIQACRGNIDDKGYLVPRGRPVESDSEGESELPIKLPSDSDFLVAYSTTIGFSSFRRYTLDGPAIDNPSSMGSWFIACLIDVLLAYSHNEDLLSMLTRVNRAMSELYTDMGYKQISCHYSMLTKKIFFPRFIEKYSKLNN